MKKIIWTASLIASVLLVSACADTTPTTAQWQTPTTGHVSSEVGHLGP